MSVLSRSPPIHLLWNSLELTRHKWREGTGDQSVDMDCCHWSVRTKMVQLCSSAGHSLLVFLHSVQMTQLFCCLEWLFFRYQDPDECRLLIGKNKLPLILGVKLTDDNRRAKGPFIKPTKHEPSTNLRDKENYHRFWQFKVHINFIHFQLNETEGYQKLSLSRVSARSRMLFSEKTRQAITPGTPGCPCTYTEVKPKKPRKKCYHHYSWFLRVETHQLTPKIKLLR